MPPAPASLTQEEIISWRQSVADAVYNEPQELVLEGMIVESTTFGGHDGTQVQATKASVENLNLLQQGKGEIAVTLGDSLLLGYQGLRLLDALGVEKRRRSRSKYGVKRPKAPAAKK